MAYSFVDWETKTPGTEVRLREGYFSLPAFSLSDQTWEGYTELVRQYNYNASSKFVIVNPPSRPSSPTFLLCVRWRSGETVTRYKLWDDQGQALGLVGAPIYEGQVIPKNFVLEIWTIKDETAPTLASALTITTTIRKLPIDYRDVSNYEDDSSPSVVTDYSVQMPTRGTGHDMLYSQDYIANLGANTGWDDSSGNERDLGNASGLVETDLDATNVIFKGERHFVFTQAQMEELGLSTGISEFFLAFNIKTYVSGMQLASLGYVSILLYDNAGKKDVNINGVNCGLDLQTDVDYVLHYKATQVGANIKCLVSVYGDDDDSKLITVTSTTIDVPSLLVLGDVGVAGSLRLAEMSCFFTLSSDEVAEAERDYLINKFIGWTVDGSFDSGVAGDDNA